jgi:lysophospholipase L1-like esterase
VVTAAMLGLGAVAAAGCGPGPGTPTVLVVGDSLLAQSSEQTQAALQAAGWNPVIDAQSGSTLTGGYGGEFAWPAVIRTLVAASNPDVVVIELGTNGCRCDNALAAADDVMRAVGDVDLVAWVTVRSRTDEPGEAGEMNSVILSTAQRWPNLVVLDLHGHFEGNPTWVGIDGVHFTDEGEAAFAQMVTEFVRSAE